MTDCFQLQLFQTCPSPIVVSRINTYIILFYIIYIILSKEVVKQYFRVTNDFYLMELTMMKGGARVRLDLDEGWCEPLHYMTIQQKRTDVDEGWCASLHYITIHQKRT